MHYVTARNYFGNSLPRLLIRLLAGVLLSLTACRVKSPRLALSASQIQTAQAAEIQSWERGREMWFDPQIGSNGRSCESCHVGGDLTNAEAYPRYKHILRTMATISMTHNFAVVNENKGQPWVLGSEDANALALYVQSLANGKNMRMAGPETFKRDWIERGRQVFSNTQLGSNGKCCQDCHPPKRAQKMRVMPVQLPLKGAAAVFPRYHFTLKKVITLEQQINYCVETYLAGAPLPLNHETVVALSCFVTSLSQGKKVNVTAVASHK
ncbi:hypothetical protein L0128_06440 [candidate division KSB1 bacterium]|nr:hypothetical protein [candidate division KSB1 bacterium]